MERMNGLRVVVSFVVEIGEQKRLTMSSDVGIECEAGYRNLKVKLPVVEFAVTNIELHHRMGKSSVGEKFKKSMRIELDSEAQS